MTSGLIIRPYQVQDKAALLKILQLNIPDYFAPEEWEDFQKYLETDLEDYYVLVLDRQVIGGGGLNYHIQEHTASLSWDLLHPNYQKQGFGRQLIQHRLKILSTNKAIKQVFVRTSQLVYRFYQKQGFMLQQCKANYWGPGYDLYHMTQTL